MEKPVKERRRLSQIGLLDSAIRTTSQLAASRDLTTRSLANRVLGDLQQLRSEIPVRRLVDFKTRTDNRK
jgi:hypothetical protein